MIKTLAKFLTLLSAKQKRELYLLQVLMLMVSVFELISTVSIMPFIALAADPNIVRSHSYLSELQAVLGSPSHGTLLLYIGALFIFLVVISNCLMLAAQFLLSRFSFRVGGEISTRLYEFYLAQDVVFHSATNSAKLIQRVMRDSAVLSTMMIAPALRLNARLFSILLLSALIVYIDPLVAMVTIAVLGSVYWFIFYVIRGTVYRNGENVSEYGQRRNQILNESFGGIKDMKLYSLEGGYLSDYREVTKASNRATADNMILGDSPYYIVETAVFAGMVLLTLYLYSHAGTMEAVLPVLTLFGMAGMRLVPKLQQSYLAITRMRAAQAAFDRVYSDLKLATKGPEYLDSKIELHKPTSVIELRDITFRYQPGSQPVLESFSSQFNVGETTVIVGASGAGKSTLLDILMGLIKPQEGSIYSDGELVSNEMLYAWRTAIGFVPQEVYLTDTNPAMNIAFGVKEDEIDMERVVGAAKAARIHDFIESLPGGYQALIGERGSQFSGGQKQRIGIARAFYRQVSILVLDEATSALDAETQAEVLQNMKFGTGAETIIMVTHRAETIAAADSVVELKEARQLPAENA